MEQELTPQYLKGFNSGYEMAKHEPELCKQLTTSMKGNGDYITGLQAGKKQFDREQDRAVIGK